MSVRRRTWSTDGVERSGWQADYVDAAGKRRRKMFRLKKDADAFLSGAKVEVRAGVHVADAETVTVEEAGKLWLKSGIDAGLERSTVDQRRRHLDLHILPIAGQVRLNKITAPWVRGFQDELRKGGRSADMVRRITVSLGSLIGDAQSRGLVIRNAVHELSRTRSSAPGARHKARLRIGVDIPSPEEIKALLAALSPRQRPLIITAVFTGMRSSELRALTWADVDTKNNLVHVRQRADDYNEVGSPKSQAGHRTIPVPPVVINTLKEWKLACPRRDGRLELVFPTGAGNVESRTNMRKRILVPAMIAAGLAIDTGEVDGNGQPVLTAKYGGFHALRHFFASWCINPASAGGLGLSPKAVQERLGHSTIAMTMDTYGHLFPAADEHQMLAAAERALIG